MPPIPGPEQSALESDMRKRGFDSAFPIVMYQGKILDGRHRYAAAMHVAKVAPDLGVKPVFREFDGDDEAALAFVVAANLHRRHLNASQRAMVAERLATMRVGRPKENASNDAVSQGSAADMLNVSRKSVQRAKEVREHAPDLAEAVESGEMSVSKAAKAARERKKPPPRPDGKPKDNRTIGDFLDEAGIVSWASNKDASARAKIASRLRSLADTVEGMT